MSAAEGQEDEQGCRKYTVQREAGRPGVFHSWEQKAKGNIAAVFNYLTQRYRENRGQALLKGTQRYRERGTGSKLERGKFWLDIWKKMFTIIVVKHWKRSPERLRDLHLWWYSELNQTRPSASWSRLALCFQWDQTTSAGPFQLEWSCDVTSWEGHSGVREGPERKATKIMRGWSSTLQGEMKATTLEFGEKPEEGEWMRFTTLKVVNKLNTGLLMGNTRMEERSA